MKKLNVSILALSALLLAIWVGGPVIAADTPKKNKYQRSKLTNDESEATADRRSLLLATGEDRAVDLDFEANAGAQGIAVGNPGVVAPTLVRIGDKRQIVFKPLKAGETTVTVRDQDGTLRLIFHVRVTGSNLLRTAGEIRELLRDIEGLEIKVVGQKVVIDGEVLVPADYGRLLAVISDKVYAETVINLATLSPMTMQHLAKKIQEDIAAFAPNVTARVVNGMIFLQGNVDNEAAAKRAAEVAKLYLPEIKPGNLLQNKDASAQVMAGRSLVQNFIIVVTQSQQKKQDKMVRITVHFVELSKDYNKVFGFKWEPGFTQNTAITIGKNENGAADASTGASFAGTISSLFPRLMSAQYAGFARVLKTGTVITRNGQSAELNEGTQYPFTIVGQNGQVTAAKEGVGLSLAATPQILGQTEDILLDLDLSQISVTGRAPAAGGPPQTATHKVKTKLYVKNNESAAVAGVQAAEIMTQFNKDDPNPGTFDSSAGTTPLFSLLRSKGYNKKKGQFVIFVTPQIIENASDGTDDLKKNFRVKVK